MVKMEFFNKKQDVIDLQLTNFGRHLLSKGKFKPVYYSFFDDDIIYDISYAGLSEVQNSSEERIKQAQRTQIQYHFSPLEKDLNTNYGMNILKVPGSKPSAEQKTAEKKYALPTPIGSMDLQSEHAPSWTIRYLNGALSSSQPNLTLKEHDGGQKVLNIPQLQTSVKMNVQIVDTDEFADELFDGPSESNIVVESPEEDYSVLLKIAENNSEFQKSNFDIEIFEVIEEKKNNITVEQLRPLYFQKPNNINDHLDIFDQVTPEDDDNYAAHYFDIKVDKEIPNALLCKYDPTNKKLGVFADERAVICQDVLNQQERTTFNIYEGSTQDIPGDIC
jgi:hypothetical protein